MQQLSLLTSLRNDWATSLTASDKVGKACTVPITSSIVNSNLTAKASSWIISAANAALALRTQAILIYSLTWIFT